PGIPAGPGSGRRTRRRRAVRRYSDHGEEGGRMTKQREVTADPDGFLTNYTPIRVYDVDEITVPERRREDVGDISPLARSIAKYDLLHPIVVDATGRLVCGERRLRAAQQLG